MGGGVRAKAVRWRLPVVTELGLPSLLGTRGLKRQVSAPHTNKSFIIIIFLRESVTYSFTCMYREVFLNIYFNG